MGLFSGPGVTPSLKGLTTNVVNLQAGAVQTLSPAGWYNIRQGKFTTIQEYDPITTTWRTIGGGATAGGIEFIYSDGQNYRLANQTGCAIGAIVVAAGSGYVQSSTTVTASAGGSKWLPIIGGLVNTTVTVTNGGLNYTYPPLVLFSAPPSPGVQATGYCTLTAGVVSSVTVVDQGAGYVSPPTVQFVNDPREGFNSTTVGYNASAVATLTGAGTLAAMLCLDHGTPVTALPTLTITSAVGTAATVVVIMDWTITAATVTTGGTGYTGGLLISAYGGFTTSTAVYLNPAVQQNLLKGRNATIVPTISTTVPQTTTITPIAGGDGGVLPGVPTLWVQEYGPAPLTGMTGVTFAVGGIADTSVTLTT